MRLIRCYDKAGKYVKFVNSVDASFPNRVVSIKLINNRFGNGIDYEALSVLLRTAPQKFDKITIINEASLSPAYLAFLVAAFNKTNCLVLKSCLRSEAEFSCLVAGLAQADGLRELHMKMERYDVPDHLFLMVLQAISSSSSLEKVDLESSNCLSEDNLTDRLIEAIETNRSLKALSLFLDWGDDEHPLVLQQVFVAIVRNGRVKDLSMGYYHALYHTGQSLYQEILMEALCNQECRLEKLRLNRIKIVQEAGTQQVSDDSKDDIPKNTSLKHLSITKCRLDCSQVTTIMRRLTSLHAVHLSGNSLQSMFMFDDLLLKKQLQSLVIENNKVGEADIKSFLMQLPATRSLQNLELCGNPFLVSKTCVRLLGDCMSQNTSLERLELGEDLAEHHLNTFSVPLSLNRAGRQYLQNDADVALATNLWPMILHRAGTKLWYYDIGDSWKHPANTRRRVDAVFWLLRERILIS
ncbi:unnamed protein product [Cylindrotheca closterium]|uniref:Uncharacterized protein n=1 Tax=Cylindrotheca closterium TaxID=2856 RepID=A0AAD2G9X6_9STRA|nr:unnamed protein product [Cylindrotheca closterium]